LKYKEEEAKNSKKKGSGFLLRSQNGILFRRRRRDNELHNVILGNLYFELLLIYFFLPVSLRKNSK
jgi:hypothetical protein